MGRDRTPSQTQRRGREAARSPGSAGAQILSRPQTQARVHQPMTDQELLALVQAKTPDELSFEETDLLRTRLAESEDLREALFGQMQMEGYLAEALGRVHFTPQDILARAHADQGRLQLTVPLVCVLLAVPIFLLLGT